ncbi:DUF6894 family protein [Microvirga aerophila]
MLAAHPTQGAMPCFYFDVRDGVNFTPDEVGREFDSLEAAGRAAAKAAAEIGGDQLPNGDARRVTVKARNEQGQWMLTVTGTLEDHRGAPAPLSITPITREKRRIGALMKHVCSGQFPVLIMPDEPDASGRHPMVLTERTPRVKPS